VRWAKVRAAKKDAFDLSVFPCAECGAPAAAEHYDVATDLLVRLCARHKAARAAGARWAKVRAAAAVRGAGHMQAVADLEAREGEAGAP